ncbi:VOC family protein [Arthrobacter sp. E3]|uniref:VOC family protein n=1 Tax=Arthrobacter sp. E3 TaxID=517402 RepID=UPI001FFD8B21|nr:VOC family protein [Arthrobacter sp. E3]
MYKCQGNADDVGRFYADVLPDTSMDVVASYPTNNWPDFQRHLAGQPLVVDVSVGGYQLRLINAGGEYRPTPALSIILTVDPRSFKGGADEARTLMATMWAALADGGEVRMPLDEYPHSKLYGWVQDKFGVNWQLMLAAPDAERRPGVMPQVSVHRRGRQGATGDRPLHRPAPELGPGNVRAEAR